MNERYQIGDLRLCRACNKAIRFAGKYWEHVPINGAIPRHIGEPLEEEAEKPSVEIKTGYVNFDANDFYALHDKLTAANARIAELERQLADGEQYLHAVEMRSYQQAEYIQEIEAINKRQSKRIADLERKSVLNHISDIQAAILQPVQVVNEDNRLWA